MDTNIINDVSDERLALSEENVLILWSRTYSLCKTLLRSLLYS